MDDQYWIRLLPWRQKYKAESKSAQIKFAPKLRVVRKDAGAYLELQLMNRSSWTVWVEEATVFLLDLDAKRQMAVPTWQARYEVLQNVEPNDTLSVSLAKAIHDSAGRPQGPYSCLVRTNVLYRVFDEWCNAKLETYRVEMEALGALGVRSARSYDKKIKQFNSSVDLTTKEHKG
jgi:hypothetical protein